MTERQFWANVEKTDSCWLWKSRSVHWSGYGWVRFKGISQGAHRVAYKLSKGSIPKGLCVCHTCDNRLCVNPDHLWLGTRRDNNVDMWQKGRGRNNPRVKIPGYLIPQLIKEREAGVYTTILAEKYGIHNSQVSRICRGLRKCG